jgi:hypothetical protein
MGGIFCQINVGRSEYGAANARYITRETATFGDSQALYLHNYPGFISTGDYKEVRKKVVEYNRQKEQFELAQKRRGRPGIRTHYRCKLSFEGKIETEIARKMAQEYLEDSFPLARAVAVVHQDTDNTHVHINIQSRQVDGLKIQLNDKQYKTLDNSWARVYGREFGEDKAREHLTKKRETEEWKREYMEARARGENPSRPKPERNEGRLKAEDYCEREGRNYGDDKTGTGRDQREAANEGARTRTEDSVIRGAKETVRSAEEFLRNVEQASRGVEETVRAREETLHRTAELRSDLAELGERTRERVTYDR